ncbi:MAG: reverse transcriptase domain-containing protein, partial [Acidobacteriaceae bacterium]
MPNLDDANERVFMKITGVLVDLLVEMAPEVYKSFVTHESNKKVVYVQVLRALYGMLVAALLWYKKFRNDLEQQGFVFNPYDPCVANKVVNNKQHTVRFHVDDLMSSHVDTKINDNFEKWLNKMYGAHGEVKTTRGKVHDYLGMVFDFSQDGQVKVDMVDYISNMVEEFPMNLKPTDTAPTPASENLFAEGDGPKLDKDKAELFHTFVAKGLFACKRARPDIHTAIALLCTRVKSPNQDDWNKLVRLIKYCNGTCQDKLILSTEDLHVIKWYVDSAFGVHPDLKSHTGAVMTYGGGAAQSISRKQKLNTRSSTEAELVGADDAATMILWTKLFMEAQGHTIEKIFCTKITRVQFYWRTTENAARASVHVRLTSVIFF